MKINYISLFLILALLVSSCQFNGNEAKQNSKKEATRVIKSYYEKSGALKSEITVKNNKKHGPAKKYYPTGEIHTLVNYDNGIKVGETVWYYKNGQPYRVTPYENGKMHGLRKKYYENGKLQAEIPYENGEIIEGTREYKEGGELIDKNIKIEFEALDNLKIESKYILKMKLSQKRSNTEFFEEKTSTEGTKVLVPIKVNQSGTGVIEYYITRGNSKMSILKINAKYKTKLGNPVLISSSYKLDIENR